MNGGKAFELRGGNRVRTDPVYENMLFFHLSKIFTQNEYNMYFQTLLFIYLTFLSSSRFEKAIVWYKDMRLFFKLNLLKLYIQ